MYLTFSHKTLVCSKSSFLNIICTLFFYSITHPNPVFRVKYSLIFILHPTFLNSFLHIFNPLPFLVVFEWKRVVRHISFLCHAGSFSPYLQQLMSCTRKMSAGILILKSKATEMSSERFRSVKCNENIFVWKCDSQHSCALRTVLGKTEGLVRCTELRHQSGL